MTGRKFDSFWHSSSAFYRYALMLLIASLAVLVRYVLDPFFGESGLAIFFAAAVVIGWICGLGPCVIAQVTMLLISMVFFDEHEPATVDNVARAVLGLGTYFFVGILAALLSQSRRTAQQRARQQADEAVRQREQLRATFACIADAVVVTDKLGRILLLNPVSERLTGWSLAECLGRPLADVFCVTARDGSALLHPIHTVLREGKTLSGDRFLLLTARSGSQFPITYTAAPVRDEQGNVTGAVVTFRDDSERMRTEETLREADRRKDEFLALLAHELRNPLAPIGNALQIFRLAEHDPAAREDARRIMQHQFEHLVRLVDDLLDISRIARGKVEMRREECQLAPIVERAIEAARPLIDSQRHELVVNLPRESIPVYGDPVRLSQVFTNLLTNAAKYTQPQGRIELSVSRDNQHAILTVTDTGIGIPAEMLESIFDMFTQVDQRQARLHSGLGIGLSLVKNILQMHGGDVQAQSEGLGKGSRFTVRLPLSQRLPASDQPRNGQAFPSSLQKRRICIVDDNVDSANSLARLLTLQQHEVHVAHNGPEALELIEQVRAEIVLLDLGMPGMDGFEVARRLRTPDAPRPLVLAALTGWGGPEDRRRTLEAGFDYHFVKPIKLDELESLLRCPEPSAAQR